MNGKVLPSARAFVKPDNHSYRYGDGLFETMKMVKGKISLADLHFDRLYKSLSVLEFKVAESFTSSKLKKEIFDLCTKNHCENLARVRLSVSRGHGGLHDGHEKLHYILECWPLQNAAIQFNKRGLIVDRFPDARKSCDVFSNLKSASHLLYVMAARFCKENGLDDCIVLNSHERVADTTVANVFWINNGNIFTPPVSEGCISGVMRRYIIQNLSSSQFNVREKSCEIADLEQADEVFVTNAIQGIKWVKQFKNTIYAKEVTERIYRQLNKLQYQ